MGEIKTYETVYPTPAGGAEAGFGEACFAPSKPVGDASPTGGRGAGPEMGVRGSTERIQSPSPQPSPACGRGGEQSQCKTCRLNSAPWGLDPFPGAFLHAPFRFVPGGGELGVGIEDFPFASFYPSPLLK